MTLIAASGPARRYSSLSKVLHWVIGIAVIVTIPVGIWMSNFLPDGPVQEQVFSTHKSIGALLLILMAVRVATRLFYGAPAPVATLGAVERRGSAAAQYSLYALLFAAPILGWLGANAYGEPVSVFGLFSLPTLLGKNQPLSDQIFTWHLVVGLVIAAVASLHISGALYHYFVKRDGVMQRMLPADDA